jgi:poly(3-hydroxybutyrate) depolymerase
MVWFERQYTQSQGENQQIHRANSFALPNTTNPRIFDTMTSPLRAAFLFLLGLSLLQGCRESNVPTPAEPDGFSLTRGSGSFTFDMPEGSQAPTLDILYHIPATGDIADMPILFVFHGADRNAAAYLEAWKSLAEARHCMVFAPVILDSDYPGSRGYQQGNLVNAAGQTLPQPAWLFSAIEPLFDDVLSRTGAPKVDYDLWGHSGGAQFVHRFVLFGQPQRLGRAVAANAGWYTVPENDADFPYGLGGSPINEAELAAPFSLPLHIHLGTEDTAFNDTAWEGAFAQGDSRFERGQYFFAHAQLTASNWGISCAWSLMEVAGVGHHAEGMAEAAAAVLYP